MAFIKAIDSYPDAYHRVNMMVADKDNGVRVLVCTYESQEARLAGASDVKTEQFNFEFNPSVESTNPVAYSYLLLKTVPEFADAVDV